MKPIPVTGELIEPGKVQNDVTIGAYDVVLETGPSYSTKRQEAKENMVEFIRSAPETAPVVMDLVAKAQDWPMADEFAKRLEAVAPPAVQATDRQSKERTRGGRAAAQAAVASRANATAGDAARS
jgi:hypothetical protein